MSNLPALVIEDLSAVTIDREATAKATEILDAHDAQEQRFESEALRVYELKLAADEAKARFEEADKAFRRELEDAGLLNEDTKGFGLIHTTIFPTRRFDPTTAQTTIEDLVKRHRITREEANACFKTVLDPKLVQNVVSPADYDKMQKTSGTTVKYSLSKD